MSIGKVEDDNDDVNEGRGDGDEVPFDTYKFRGTKFLHQSVLEKERIFR